MKIFTGQDRARELGFDTYRNFMIKLAVNNGKPWKGEFTESNPLFAYVDNGRWSTMCECNSGYYVEPTDSEFGYCPVCGNAVVDGAARRIIFPEDKEDIEQELLERELISKIHPDKIDTQTILMPGLVRPKYIARNWQPGETVETLREEHKNACLENISDAVIKAVKKTRRGKHG